MEEKEIIEYLEKCGYTESEQTEILLLYNSSKDDGVKVPIKTLYLPKKSTGREYYFDENGVWRDREVMDCI